MKTLIGWIRFHGQGEAPDRHMGLLYDGFIMPPRDTLGDDDPASWEIGLSGQPQDPWHIRFAWYCRAQTPRRCSHS